MKSLTLIALAGYAILAGSASNAAQATRTESCKVTTEQEIASLFDRWNQSLQTGDPHKVVANYAERSILLPTVSNKPHLTPALHLTGLSVGPAGLPLATAGEWRYVRSCEAP